MEKYKKIHTTSTKCQYQEASSNLVQFVSKSEILMDRNNTVNKYTVPIKTWIPWKPVNTKKEVPKVLSLKEKKDLEYSRIWSVVKIRPRATVRNKYRLKSLIFRTDLLKCLMVTVTPDDNRTRVLISGTLIKLNISTPTGGHIKPNSKLGDRKKWKYDQKNEKKNSTSDLINNNIADFSPLSIELDSLPVRENSPLYLSHQKNAPIEINKRDTNRGLELLNFIMRRIDINKFMPLKLEYKGQGLGLNKKKWWDLVIIDIVIT